MLAVADALKAILGECHPLGAVKMPVLEAVGLVLAADVASDIDSPPHDKAMVDGYAIRAAELASGTADLGVIEEVTAGAVPARAVSAGEATRIMTGAPIPSGADAVVMIERARESADGRVVLVDRPPAVGQNIMRRGAATKRGEVVIAAGTVIRPIEVGVLSEVGRTKVRVVSRPTVAVLATGNELVPADQTPGAGQIRNSNGPMLAAAVTGAGGVAEVLGIAPDDPERLSAAIIEGLSADVLLLSGGVSAGVLDLVPNVLVDLGVERVFHKVQLKPGKPLWFGVRRREAKPPTLVFGLPGNPVSSFVCFELFVRAAIARLAGRENAITVVPAVLTEPFSHRGDRPTYHPARLHFINGRFEATPVAWKGSSDLAALVRANALIQFPAGDRAYQTGDMVEVHRLQSHCFV
jgi:molybdopterin molybdotransferase